MSDKKKQWHLQWVHSDGGKELIAWYGDGSITVGRVDYDQSTVTVFMRAWRQVVGMPLIGKEAAEIVYDKTSENPDCIIVDFLRSMLPAGVLFPPYLPDVDHRSKTAAEAEPELLDNGPEMVAARSYSELDTAHRFRVLLQLHDLLERAADHEPGWGHEDSRFVLKTMLRELTLR